MSTLSLMFEVDSVCSTFLPLLMIKIFAMSLHNALVVMQNAVASADDNTFGLGRIIHWNLAQMGST